MHLTSLLLITKYLESGRREEFIPPASIAIREVANLTERKNPQTPVKEFVCLSMLDVEFYQNVHVHFQLFAHSSIVMLFGLSSS